MYSSIKKRNDVVVKFNAQKIEVALTKAGEATGEYDKKVAKELATKVIARAEKTIKKLKINLPMFAGKSLKLINDDAKGNSSEKDVKVNVMGDFNIEIQPNGGFILR